MTRLLKAGILLILLMAVIVLRYSKVQKILDKKELLSMPFRSQNSFLSSNSTLENKNLEENDEMVEFANFDVREQNAMNAFQSIPKDSFPMNSFRLNDKDTTTNSGNLVIYNRISKCGSMTMISLIHRLAKRNNFHVSRTINIKKIVDGYHPGMKNTIYIEHKSFQPIPLHLREKITYINVWRDPIKRYISGYHYFRDHLFKKYVSFTRKGEIMIVNDMELDSISPNWVKKNVHTCGNEGLRDGVTHRICQKGKKYLIKVSSVVKHVKSIAHTWYNKIISSCVNDVHDAECNDFSATRPTQMSMTRLLLYWHAGKKNLLGQAASRMYPPFFYNPTAGRYLCGTQPFCRSTNSKKASDRIIKNIDSHFSVIGVVEDMIKTLAVLEHKLPLFFTGAVEEYKNMKDEKVKNEKWSTGKVANKINTGSYADPSQTVIDKLKKHFTEEYRGYDYVVKRLNRQYSKIRHS